MSWLQNIMFIRVISKDDTVFTWQRRDCEYSMFWCMFPAKGLILDVRFCCWDFGFGYRILVLDHVPGL